MCIYIYIHIYVCVVDFLALFGAFCFSFTVRGKNTFACSGRARRDGPKKPFENTKNALDTDKRRLRRNAEVWLIAALLMIHKTKTHCEPACGCDLKDPEQKGKLTYEHIHHANSIHDYSLASKTNLEIGP